MQLGIRRSYLVSLQHGTTLCQHPELRKHTSGWMKEEESWLHIHSYLKGETWCFSLNLSLTGLRNEVLKPLCVFMFTLYPFRSAFSSLGSSCHCWRPPCRAFCFTSSGGSIQARAPGKATGSIQKPHGARVQILPANMLKYVPYHLHSCCYTQMLTRATITSSLCCVHVALDMQMTARDTVGASLINSKG